MRFRRFQNYDYSKGAILFVTCSILPRNPIMARISDAQSELTEIGKTVQRCLAIELEKTPQISLMRSVIMPDHIHLLLRLQPNTERPKYVIGHFMQNFKRWSKYEVQKLPGYNNFTWDANFHDRLALSAPIIDRIIKYIDNNPLKWSLMHGVNPPLKVIEPIADERIPHEEWWSGVGNLALLKEKIAAVRLSTKISPDEMHAVVNRCLTAVDKGYTLAGTFISPCEQRLQGELVSRKIPFIKMIPDELATVYRPKDDEPILFAEDRYLLLSRIASKADSRYNAWHGINQALEDMAMRNGTSLYVHRKGGAATELVFEFRF